MHSDEKYHHFSKKLPLVNFCPNIDFRDIIWWIGLDMTSYLHHILRHFPVPPQRVEFFRITSQGRGPNWTSQGGVSPGNNKELIINNIDKY